ncbi:right-handed parallel beta-helix repeat-containing protein [Patescibacteria group bacterium]|nr:right-handed parallel beta-helix repeat-containing protein [Patescibacteria group bacterium]MBU4347463.1 right-handed parallel beta-helix repeat-containing protein [Patescibacteria group bacterium]MBU4455333.1 right-handed parallel beta-helix repeat-containing protein [Patescibacteria group bacterium]MCG2690598.1 right-handed parallel beta-helix repeat-containing protein [Candidatus Parcubacteria bacterium]
MAIFKKTALFLISLLVVSFCYFHLPQAQAAQEVIGLIRQDCAGFSNCYTSLSAWEAAYGGINFGSCAQGDLVCADKIAVAKIDGAWTQPDTNRVTIDGWTTGPNNYIRIYTAPEARHKGIAGTGYRLITTASSVPGIYIYEGHVRIEGLEFQHTNTYNNSMNGITIYNSGVPDNDIRLIGLLVHDCSSPGTYEASGVSIGAGPGKVIIANSIFYNNKTDGVRAGTNSSTLTVYSYNNTFVNNGRYGLYKNWSNAVVSKNNYAGGNLVADYFASTGSISMTTSASSDATGSAGLRNIAVSDSAGAYFMNLEKGSENFHIQSSLLLKDAGTNLSADANLAFSDDIDGQTRSAPWDIGADETAASGETPAKFRFNNGMFKIKGKAIFK